MEKNKRAKKNKKAAKNKISDVQNINVLPQNIVSVGEQTLENKQIYISQPCYKAIHCFTESNTVNESGGILIGNIVNEFGKTNIVVDGFIEAKYCEATPTTLKFTHETWEYCHKEIDKKHQGQKIVGWIHTHPDFGIFLSEYDTFIHENFFKEDYQVAFVVDPIRNEEGFYIWMEDKIVRCKGFYLFDNTGVDISLREQEDEVGIHENEREKSAFTFKNILFGILTVAVLVLAYYCTLLNEEIRTLKKNQDILNHNGFYLQQEMNQLKNEIAQWRMDVESVKGEDAP